LDSFKTLGKEKSLEILSMVKEKYKMPILTDVHETWECKEVANYVDVLQIPAFLCRQTDLLISAGETGKIVNIKKGQFLSPQAMKYAVEKVKTTGNSNIWLTERGTTFGYNNLIVDMTSFPIMKQNNVPVIIDATTLVQIPNQTEGNRWQSSNDRNNSIGIKSSLCRWNIY
jgi:2-dehydro-3-deoxyphosphooctonate aldolase (KDO 8-P synthase)